MGFELEVVRVIGRSEEIAGIHWAIKTTKDHTETPGEFVPRNTSDKIASTDGVLTRHAPYQLDWLCGDQPSTRDLGNHQTADTRSTGKQRLVRPTR